MFEFRKYKKGQGKKKQKHEKLIVDNVGCEFGFMGLTHSKTKGKGHNNFPLKDNPQLDKNFKRLPFDCEKGHYLRRKIEYDNKNNFGEPLSNFSLSKRDKKRIKDYIKDKKRKK